MEIEAKFALPDRETLRRLLSAHTLAGFGLSEPLKQNVVDVYLDTPERRLFDAGLACRQRQMDGQVLIALKDLAPSQGAVHRRQELESSVPSSSLPDEWPEPLRERMLPIVGDEPLLPWFELRQTRIVRKITEGDRPVGQLSLDEVCVKANGRTETSLQVEAELAQQGTTRDLESLVGALEHEWQLTPERRSKFEWALHVLGAAPPRPKRGRKSKPARSNGRSSRAKIPNHPDIRLDESMAEAARKTLELHLRRMVSHEDDVRNGHDREAVHDMRVAIRRMRAALFVFDRYIDRKTIKPFARGLKRTGRALGAVRDLDVFMVNTERYLHTLPPDRQSDLDPLLNVWKAEHKAAREKLEAWLDSNAYRDLRDEFAALVQKPGALDRPTSKDDEVYPTRVSHVLPIILFSSLARVRAYETEMQPADVPLTRYHQLRIASKGLRYTLEFFEPVLAPEAKISIEQIKALQDHLGHLQDEVVACDILRGFLVWGSWKPAKSKRKPVQGIVAPGVALYLSVRQNEIENLTKSFAPVWSPVADPEFTRRLVGLVAAL